MILEVLMAAGAIYWMGYRRGRRARPSKVKHVVPPAFLQCQALLEGMAKETTPAWEAHRLNLFMSAHGFDTVIAVGRRKAKGETVVLRAYDAGQADIELITRAHIILTRNEKYRADPADAVRH